MRSNFLRFIPLQLLLLSLCSILLAKTSEVDLRFVFADAGDPAYSDEFLDVTLQIRSVGKEFKLGSSQLVFTYDQAALGEPECMSVFNFSNNEFYKEARFSEDTPGVLSFEVQLMEADYGEWVSDNFVDVAKFRFYKHYQPENEPFFWQIDGTTRTQVVMDDEKTEVPFGTLKGLFGPQEGSEAAAISSKRIPSENTAVALQFRSTADGTGTNNDQVLEVVVQMRSEGKEFNMGSSQLVFTYDQSCLEGPELVQSHRFNSDNYKKMTLDENTGGRVVIAVSLQEELAGESVPDKFVDVATIRFYMTSPMEFEPFHWWTLEPEPTMIYHDDQVSLVPFGTLKGLFNPLGNDSFDPGVQMENGVANVSDSPQLLGNYPNPFNPSTDVRFTLAQSGNVNVAVFNMLGQKVRSLVNGFRQAGTHQVRWDGTSDTGAATGSGVYLLQLRSGASVQTMRMMLIK